MKKGFVWFVLAVSVVFFLTGCASTGSASGASGAASDSVGAASGASEAAHTYEDTLFDSSYVHRVDITIAEADWDDLLANPLEKTKYKASIEIDGELFDEVSVATKGNSSLAFVAADGLSRYSYKVNFSKYDKNQTYHGLNKMNLHNGFYDTTYMKDYFSYEIFRQAGVDAPLTSFVWLTVNGEDRGLYLAVEDEAESFLDRTLGGEGVIYKPESSDLGLTVEKVNAVRANGLPMAKETHGSDLAYKDDDIASYPDIFKNNETKAKEADNLAVIAALKHLSTGTDLEDYLHTAQIISFFAAHNFLLNYDSYTAGMLHNLVLFIHDGKLGLLPWDYNLSYATFVPAITNMAIENATDILNQGIDSPLFLIEDDSRPMWSWIVNDPQYLAAYHDALDDLIAYFESGKFEEEARAMHDLLLPYVEKDPTAFYDLDAFERGFETLVEFCKRRAQSIRLQLDGKLATRNADQRDQDKVDASDLVVFEMGGPDWVY